MRIYNEALGGTTSPMILNRLEGYIDLYKPDLIIAMMGINDTHLLNLKKNALPCLFSKILLIIILLSIIW